jgi:myb proto-oncogene protein
MLDIEEEMRKNPFWPYRVKAPKKKKERPEPAEPKERRKWSTEEDDLLRTAVSKHGETNWVAVSGDVATRDNGMHSMQCRSQICCSLCKCNLCNSSTFSILVVQCIQRWSRIKPGAIKGAWSEEEDALLVYLVGMGFPNWGKVAAQLPGRSPKQCRERWNHHLDPSINKTEFTPEEDEIICKKFEELGSKWSIISKSLPGRTDNSVRTRFQALKRRDSKSEPHDKIRKRAKSSRNAKDFHVVTALVDKGIVNDDILPKLPHS